MSKPLPPLDRNHPATMTDPAPPFPSLRALSGKKVTAAFDGGRITSDGGVVLLAEAERKLAIADRLAEPMPDLRDPTRFGHLLVDILRAGILAIGTGYEDADDLDALRHDPAFRMALSKTPEAGGSGARSGQSANPVALGDCSGPAQRDRDGIGDDRSLLRQPCRAARDNHAGHR